MKRRVLFISHNAKRQGAPIVLLAVLKWLKANTDLEFDVLLPAAGPLRPQFASLAHTVVARELADSEGLVRRAARRIARKGDADYPARDAARHFARRGIGLVYANTVANGPLLEALAPLGCPVVCHVHELEFGIEYLGPENFEQVRRAAKRYVANSLSVKENLAERHGIPRDRIDMVRACTEAEQAPRAKRDGSLLREAVGLGRQSVVVGGSGALGWHKGIDLFVQLAGAVARRRMAEDVHFVWIGGSSAPSATAQVRHDIRLAGLGQRVHLIPEVENPLDYYEGFDVLALTSREESCSLVCVECARLGKPVVCFAGAGGAPEFVDPGAGFTTPYLDVEAMADKVALLVQSPAAREQMGCVGADRARERHDVSVCAPQIYGIIRRLLS